MPAATDRRQEGQLVAVVQNQPSPVGDQRSVHREFDFLTLQSNDEIGLQAGEKRLKRGGKCDIALGSQCDTFEPPQEHQSQRHGYPPVIDICRASAGAAPLRSMTK